MNIKIFREAFIGVLKLKSKKFEPKVVIRNAEIINEGLTFNGDLAIEGNYISEVKKGNISGTFDREIDATGLT